MIFAYLVFVLSALNKWVSVRNLIKLYSYE